MVSVVSVSTSVFRGPFFDIVNTGPYLFNPSLGERDGNRGMEDYCGPSSPPGPAWHQFEPSCQWVLIMEVQDREREIEALTRLTRCEGLRVLGSKCMTSRSPVEIPLSLSLSLSLSLPLH